jgi:hypothetical protein
MYYTILQASRKAEISEALLRWYIKRGKLKTEIISKREIPHIRGLPLWVKCIKSSDLQEFQAKFGEEIRQKSYSKP